CIKECLVTVNTNAMAVNMCDMCATSSVTLEISYFFYAMHSNGECHSSMLKSIKFRLYMQCNAKTYVLTL
ncbi:MAG: hypothetical protein ACRCZO_16820, partial [Cetobacterium sp.]